MLNQEDILLLIALNQEGPYWDFKRQWYETGHERDMLHDIICMSNNLKDRDSYIIIGVDEENDYALVDVTNDPNRRNTQKIVDFLRDKKFAGDIRPTVTVETLLFNGSAIDVIIVHNSNNTPFYLKESFNGINAANIYTRIQDTNTPVNKSADIAHVEYLWKKRFGLLLAPVDRIKVLLLDKENWEQCSTADVLHYYKYFPEYTIGYPLEDPEDRHGYEFYILNQTDNQPWWTVIEIRYHQTLLKDMSGIILDGGRHIAPCPLMDGVSLQNKSSWDFSYRYFVKDSLEYCVHEFFFDKDSYDAIWADKRFMENILLFESEDEHQLFNYYAEKNWKWFKEQYSKDIREPFLPDLPGYNMGHFREEIVNAQMLQLMLDEYRKQSATDNQN